MSTQTPDPGPKGANTASVMNHRLFFALLPQVPLMLRVTLLHMLRLSQQSKYLDLRTELIIAVMRSFINPSRPKSVTETQRLVARYPSLKGRIWVSTYACPPPPAGETGLQDAIAQAVDGLRDAKTPAAAYQMPEPAPVEAEWTGYRASATPESRLPDVSQKELYGEMMKEVSSPTTVLYFHGGAYWLADPASHRPTAKKLAKLTGGRVYSVRYRLAPQHPFPAALMDALMSYLGLLYPPEGAFHEPVRPEHIVFAGDSAGGNLALALLQLILHLNRTSPSGHATIPWHGAAARKLPLPAGVAVNSPWMDLTHSSPSCTANAAFDYLPTPAQQRALDARRPACAAWPPPPPPPPPAANQQQQPPLPPPPPPPRPRRSHLYATDDTLLAHPLLTLLLAPSWAGAPPVYVCTGWELLADEDKLAAGRMWRQGVRVVLEEYEAMPHCFALVLPRLREARRCMDGWARFIRAVTAVVGEGEAGVESRFVTVRARSLEEVPIEPAELCKDGEEEAVAERIWKQVRERGVPEDGVAKL